MADKPIVVRLPRLVTESTSADVLSCVRVVHRAPSGELLFLLHRRLLMTVFPTLSILMYRNHCLNIMLFYLPYLAANNADTLLFRSFRCAIIGLIQTYRLSYTVFAVFSSQRWEFNLRRYPFNPSPSNPTISSACERSQLFCSRCLPAIRHFWTPVRFGKLICILGAKM